jgi:2-oxoglutarate dehydrogenase complex dehydrogenase (E1) component-like enzyme
VSATTKSTGFTVHLTLGQPLANRERMAHDGDIDRAFAELLAFGGLARQGRQRCAATPARR